MRRRAAEIRRIRSDIATLVADMYETMEERSGIGLAAPQIGVSRRVIVVDVPQEDGFRDRFALINPRIVRYSGGEESLEEGCLSIPGVHAEVRRRRGVVVAGLDEEGREVEHSAEGLLARCLMHEIDHLEGVLFIDRAGISESAARKTMEEFLAAK